MVPEPVEGPQTTSFEQLVELMVKHRVPELSRRMAKVKADDAAASVRMNLAEYLEKGIVK